MAICHPIELYKGLIDIGNTMKYGFFLSRTTERQARVFMEGLFSLGGEIRPVRRAGPILEGNVRTTHFELRTGPTQPCS
jgi:hypothetical protein